MINKVKETSLQNFLTILLQIIKESANPFKFQNLIGWTQNGLSQYSDYIIRVISLEMTFIVDIIQYSLDEDNISFKLSAL